MRARFLVLPVFLVACTGDLTIAQQTAVACSGYADALRSITPFKAEMNASQVAVVDQANAIVLPACKSAAEGTSEPTQDVLRVVRDRLRELVLLQNQVKEET